MKSQKSVLLALSWHDHRLLNGIATYATEHDWHISAASITKELAIPWGWNGDGVLAWLAGNEELCEFVVSLKKPTVDFSLRRATLPFTYVAQDHFECARMAADHFLRRSGDHRHRGGRTQCRHVSPRPSNSYPASLRPSFANRHAVALAREVNHLTS